MSYSQYCTAADIDLLLSSAGVRACADHDDDGLVDDSVISTMIDRASAEVAARILSQYEDAQAANSSLVKEWTAVLACRRICMLRGNGVPASLEAEFERIAGKDGLLEQVARGDFKLRDATRKNRALPTFSNLKIDRRHIHEQVRVVDESSDKVPTVQERDSLNREVSHG